jgi:hypothetical protein
MPFQGEWMMCRRGTRRRAKAMKEKLAENPGLMLERVVSKEEVEEECRFLRHVWRDRIFTPMVTLWTFLAQVLDPDSACKKAVARVMTFLSVTKGLDASHDPGAYCKARKRLPAKLLPWLTRLVAGKLAAKVEEKQLWQGHRVKLVDGSSVAMPDTEENQAEYPQPTTQKPGCGFPVARIVGVFDLITGALVELAIGALSLGETVLFHTLRDSLERGDVVVGDRYFGSYADIALLLERGVHGVYRLHQRRPADFRKGTRLGRNDRLVQWTKGTRPKWLSQERHDALPETLTLRMVRAHRSVAGWRAEKVIVVTTLVDPKVYPAREITDLFLRRWEVETDLGHLKTTMKMEFLRTKSPDMIRRELWAHLLAYNLVRTLMWDAGSRHRVAPLRLSFKSAMQETMVMWPFTAGAARRCDLSKFYTALLAAIASHRIPLRPHRSEPRVRKRRPKNYRLMTIPRHECKKGRIKRRP